MSIAGFLGLARFVGAWMILTTLVLTFSQRLLMDFSELQTESWLAATLCIQTTLQQTGSQVRYPTTARQ